MALGVMYGWMLPFFTSVLHCYEWRFRGTEDLGFHGKRLWYVQGYFCCCIFLFLLLW